MAIGNPITLTNNVAAKVISATATANQTLFTVTGGYRINQIAVFRNGVRLVDSSDYTARDGASVTLLSPATEGDVLEFQIFDDFRVADAIVSNETEQTISGALNVTGGINVGIQSAGTQITTGVITAINFVGTGNTVQYDSSSKTVAVSIAGGGGGGLGTAIKYSDEATDSPFSYIDRFASVKEDLLLDTTKAGVNTSIIVSVTPNIEINSGVAVTVGAGKTMIIDVLQIGDL
jgi:hypothetical protein|tara:strand:- start:135 stop:833 length:699 start_codon:yes stop_codon:yes gene_type:complete